MKLDDLEKKNVFNTPDGYFKELPSIIQSRVIKKEKESFFARIIQFGVIKLAGAAMAIILVFYFGISNYDFNPSGTEQQDYLAIISNETMSDYLMNSELDEYDIIEVAYENGVQLIETETFEVTQEILEDELDLEDVENYYF